MPRPIYLIIDVSNIGPIGFNKYSNIISAWIEREQYMSLLKKLGYVSQSWLKEAH